MTYSPWRDIGSRYPSWVVRFGDLQGMHEVMSWGRQVILLEESRSIAERRSDLAHAIGHLDLDHRGDTFNRKHEEAASRHAAKMLIYLEPLADALEWSHNYTEAAELLRVDVVTLLKRLQHLHPAERAVIQRRLGAAP